jgi:hypothetical protein
MNKRAILNLILGAIGLEYENQIDSDERRRNTLLRAVS